MAEPRVFTQKKEIMAYLGTSRHNVVDALVQAGLPVVFINNRWWSSPAAIDAWLRDFFLQCRGQQMEAKPGGTLPREILDFVDDHP